ncbi:TetR family transcriptional regulator [Micromonosporaceae bacterium Da 78-11]
MTVSPPPDPARAARRKAPAKREPAAQPSTTAKPPTTPKLPTATEPPTPADEAPAATRESATEPAQPPQVDRRTARSERTRNTIVDAHLELTTPADEVPAATPKSATGPAQPPRVDGRTARSERTRNAIVDAHLELIREGDLRPTADRIAKQAGVSLRALWSHFADMEALFTASGRRVLELRAASHQPIPPDLPLPERIAAFAEQQARLLEQIAPMAKAAALKEPFSDALQRYRRLHVSRTRAELAELFDDELNSDEDRLNALIAVSMWPNWSTWREVMSLPPETAQRLMARTVTALLAG